MKLSFMRLNIKKLVVISFILLFIIKIQLVFSATLAISPSELNFKSNINEKICKEIELKFNSAGLMFIEDRWANSSNIEKDIRKFTVSKKELAIDIDYPNKLFLNQTQKISVCLQGKNPGEFYGGLLFKPNNNSFGIVIWIKVDIRADNNFNNTPKSGFLSLTGSAINLVKQDMPKFQILSAVLIFDVFLLICLLFLIFRLRRKKRALL